MPVSIPGIENLSPAVKYVIAFAIIFLMLVLLALILRRLTGGRMSLSNERGRARQPRLGIVDVYDLDRQRQLILLRRDNVEHLLLVGGPNDVVVETNIVRVPGARLPAGVPADTGDRPDMVGDRNVEIAPVRPVVEPGLGRAGDRLQDAVGGHLGPSDQLAAVAGGLPESGGGYREPVLKPTRVTGAPPSLTPQGNDRQQPPRAPLPRANPQPSNGPGLPDMTRQLEEALRRPEPPPPPPPVPRPAPPPPPPPQPAPRPRPPEPAPKPPAVLAVPPPPPPPQASPPSPPAPRAEPAPRPAPPPAAPKPPPPQPAPPPASAAPAAPAPVPPPAPAPAKPDPFSIEDIEAEFARLLGRPLDKKE